MNETSECVVLEHDEVISRSVESLERALDEQEGLLSPRTAAVELRHEFRVISSMLSPTDKGTQDDLAQEMALGALECQEAHPASYYCWLGACRAKDWLRWWIEPIARRSNLTREERKFLEEQKTAIVRAEAAILQFR